MAITLIASLIIMAAYFLLLYGGVGFIQDKKFFSSAPKENLDAIPDKKPERFPGARIVGWIICVTVILMFIGAFILAAWDGVRNGYGFSNSSRAFSQCSISWRYTIYSSPTDSCCAARTFSHTSTPN